MKSTERIYIYDTTLRDGQQTQGVTFSLEDKNKITFLLERLGIDYIEGGWPGANPTDSKFFSQKLVLKKSRLVAFGMTKRFGRSVENDEVLAVAYQYTVGGQVFQVGEFANDGLNATEVNTDLNTGNVIVNNQSLVLKMLWQI